MTDYIKLAENIAQTSRKSEIQTMLDFGKLLEHMQTDGHPKACRNYVTFCNALNKQGEVYTSEYFKCCHLLYKKFPAAIRKLMVDTGMRERVAHKAAHWTPDAMKERLQEAQKIGWSNIIEKYIMKKGQPHRTHKPQPFVHRANSIHAGTEENLNMVNLKRGGEWNEDEIVKVLAHLMTAVPFFDKALLEAARFAGKKLTVKI